MRPLAPLVLLLALGASLALFLPTGTGLAAQRVPSRYDHSFRKYSKRYFGPGFDWRLFKAQGIAESGLDSAATSPAGARGIMQLLPSTFQAIHSKNPELASIDRPEWNIAAGIQHDRSMWHLWRDTATPRDRLGFMFASYNAGRTTILRAQDGRPRQPARSEGLDEHRGGGRQGQSLASPGNAGVPHQDRDQLLAPDRTRVGESHVASLTLRQPKPAGES